MADRTIPAPNKEVKHRTNAERRAWVRFATSQEICCQPIAVLKTDDTNTGWLGTLCNLSSGGLALRMNRRFKPGTLLMIEWPDMANGEPRFFPVQVVHATAEATRQWIIGCAFLHPLGEEQLQALIGE
jgi:hypothetical protein